MEDENGYLVPDTLRNAPETTPRQRQEAGAGRAGQLACINDWGDDGRDRNAVPIPPVSVFVNNPPSTFTGTGIGYRNVWFKVFLYVRCQNLFIKQKCCPIRIIFFNFELHLFWG